MTGPRFRYHIGERMDGDWVRDDTGPFVAVWRDGSIWLEEAEDASPVDAAIQRQAARRDLGRGR